VAIEFSSAATLQMVGGTVLATITQGQTTTTLVAFVSQQKLTTRSTQPTIFRGIRGLTECHEG